MSRYTPGPWEAGEWNTAKGGCWVNAKDIHICCIDGEAEDPMADARLIAAAPELLAACKDALNQSGLWFMRLENAIAKAEGRAH